MANAKLRAAIDHNIEPCGSNRRKRLVLSAQHKHWNLNRICINMQRLYSLLILPGKRNPGDSRSQPKRTKGRAL
jgi:hypothetical protein